MTAVGAGKSGDRIVGTVRVSGIFVIAVFCHYIIFVFIVRQREFSFSVSYPDT